MAAEGDEECFIITQAESDHNIARQDDAQLVVSAQRDDVQVQPNFMTLPLELRLMIYEFALSTDEVLEHKHVRSIISSNPVSLPTILKLDFNTKAALYPKFLKLNKVLFSPVWTYGSSIKSWEARHGLRDTDEGLSCIRHVVLRGTGVLHYRELSAQFDDLARCSILETIEIGPLLIDNLESADTRRELAERLLQGHQQLKTVVIVAQRCHMRGRMQAKFSNAAAALLRDMRNQVDELAVPVTVEMRLETVKESDESLRRSFTG